MLQSKVNLENHYQTVTLTPIKCSALERKFRRQSSAERFLSIQINKVDKTLNLIYQ